MTGGFLLKLILLIVTCGLLFFVRHQSAFSPLRMFLYGWLIVLGASAAELVVYGRAFSLTAAILVLGTVLAFAAGTHAAPKYAVQDRPFGQSRDRIDSLTLILLCLFAAVGTVLVLQEMRGVGFTLLDNFSIESGVRRDSMWKRFNSGEAEYSPIRSIGSVSCLAVATLLPYATKNKLRPLQFAAAASAVVVTADALLAVGRFTFGMLVMCLLVSSSLVYGGQAVRKVFTLRRLLIGIPVAVYFLVIFPTQRSGYLADSAQRALQHGGDAKFPDWVTNIAAAPGMQWFEVLAYSSSYFAGALDKLNYFATETDIFTWYKLGLYNVPQISQALGVVQDGVTPWHQIRLNIAEVLSGEGWSLNPWSTGIRDLGIDFGILTLPVIFILGYVAQTIYNKSVAHRSYIGLVAATYMSVGCLLFAFISPFQIRILSNGFWLLGAFTLVHYFLAGKEARAKPQGQTAREPQTSAPIKGAVG